MRISDWSSDVCSSDLQRVFGGAQFLAQALEGAGVVVVAVDVAQLRRELFESRLVDAAVVLEAVAGAFAQLVDRPARMGHADHRHVEPAARDHRLQRGKDLLVGKVAKSEEHTSELQSLMRISYAVFCLKKKKKTKKEKESIT